MGPLIVFGEWCQCHHRTDVRRPDHDQGLFSAVLEDVEGAVRMSVKSPIGGGIEGTEDEGFLTSGDRSAEVELRLQHADGPLIENLRDLIGVDGRQYIAVISSRTLRFQSVRAVFDGRTTSFQ